MPASPTPAPSSETTAPDRYEAFRALAARFPDEVVTSTHVRYVDLPLRAGRAALLTLDNGRDHTRPNTLGPATRQVRQKERNLVRHSWTHIGAAAPVLTYRSGARASGIFRRLRVLWTIRVRIGPVFPDR